MRRRLKSVGTSLLLTCFVLLALAQVERPLRQLSLDRHTGLSLPHPAVTRHLALEAPTIATDATPPAELGSLVIEGDLFWVPGHAPARQYAFTPLGPFWNGRILRRIASAEPDGH